MRKKVLVLLLTGLLLSGVGLLLISGVAMAKKPSNPGKDEASFSIDITGDIIASATLRGSDRNWEPPKKLNLRLKAWTATGEATITKFGPFNVDKDDSLACANGNIVEPGMAELTVKHGFSSTKDIWLTMYVWSDSEGEHQLETLDRTGEDCEQCISSWSDEIDAWTVICNGAEAWYTVRSGNDVTKCKLLVTYEMVITRKS